jgi:hypothetical protein
MDPPDTLAAASQDDDLHHFGELSPAGQSGGMKLFHVTLRKVVIWSAVVEVDAKGLVAATTIAKDRAGDAEWTEDRSLPIKARARFVGYVSKDAKP